MPYTYKTQNYITDYNLLAQEPVNPGLHFQNEPNIFIKTNNENDGVEYLLIKMCQSLGKAL
ncbi:hypothetical protein F511_47762 [Dorcoceras hygrometricum]|uniref:Uncharacterized protein n=1 Tax=Dorcoceras hygrometricum TaxID=472368 RepID=A0A2Z6ZWM2_9LAMI|nr:hypothetical protein F511_47762 [Dorcoceras hygrometricum]